MITSGDSEQPPEDLEVADRPGETTGSGRFELLAAGERIGKIDYHVDHDHEATREIPHTEVDPAHRGQGLSKVLIRGALDQTRSEGLRVLPTCPAVSAFIRTNPEYLELVPDDAQGDVTAG